MHTLRTNLLLCMLIYINYAGSEALNLLNQMQPKFKEESDLGTEDLIYKKATEQLKQQKTYFQIDQEDTKNEVSFREFYKNVRSGKVEDEEINIVEPEHKEIEIQSYLQELSDGLEPQNENITETQLQTDPEKLGKFKKYFIKEDETKQQLKIQSNNENTQPIEKKMTLREKLEMKKKQAQQSSVVAAIQIKQELNNQEQVNDSNIGKTTLIKKIEEFKKLKQTKETQQETQSETQQETFINTVPENPLRKLLNKKAEERKEQELKLQVEQDKLQIQTQEVEIELQQVEVQDIQQDHNTNNEQVSSNDDSYNVQEQHNIISDEKTNNDVNIDQQQIQSQVDTNIESQIQEDKSLINNESQSFQQDLQDITIQDQDQNQQQIVNQEQNNSTEDQSQFIIKTENQEQDIDNINNDQEQQNNDQINQEIQQQNQEFEGKEQQQLEVQQDNQTQDQQYQSQDQQIDNQTQDEQIQDQQVDNQTQDEQQYIDDQAQNQQQQLDNQTQDEQQQQLDNQTQNEQQQLNDQTQDEQLQQIDNSTQDEQQQQLDDQTQDQQQSLDDQTQDQQQQLDDQTQDYQQQQVDNQTQDEQQQIDDQTQDQQQQIDNQTQDELQQQIDNQIQDQQEQQIDNQTQDQQQDQQDSQNQEEQQQQIIEQDLNQENQQEVIDTINQLENNEIANDNKVENTLSEGFVMENNVENSDYLEDVEEAEQLKKKREVEEMIEEEEIIKQELEQKELEDEKQLNELEEEEKLLINEKEQELQEIEKVQKQIDEDQSQLQDFELKQNQQQESQDQELKQDNILEVQPQQEVLQEDLNVQIDDKPQQNQIDQQQSKNKVEQTVKQEVQIEPLEIKPSDGSIQLQDETLENGFNIDEYQRLQHKNEDKTEQDASNYSQSSELFHQNDYITQIINDQQEEVIQQSVPILSIDEQTDFNDQDVQQQPQIQITQEISSDYIINTSDQENNTQNNQEQEVFNDQNNITKKNQIIEEKNTNTDQLEDNELKEQDQSINLDNQIENKNEIEISNVSPKQHTLEESKIEIDNENDNNQLDQQQFIQQETQNQGDDTPLLIPVDEIENKNTLKINNEVVQDISNSLSNDDIKNNEQQIHINDKLQLNTEQVVQKQYQDKSNVLTANKLHSISQLQQDMKNNDKIKIEQIDLNTKQEQSDQENTLIHQKRQQSSLLQVEDNDMDYNEKQYEIFMSQKKQQKQLEKERKKKKLKVRQQKQRKLEEEQFQQKLLQQKQQQEILKQQQQLIELQNQQLLNKQKYKIATKQNNQVILDSKPIKGDNFIHLQKQQSQIQILNQQIDNEFSFQQILSKVEKEERQGQKQLRSNHKHVKNTDLNFFQLTEKQQQNKISLQSQDLFEAIKQEIKECDLNNYTINLCQLCQSDVVYEINDDNWYLIGIAYGLKRHFQNLLNTVQYHFKNSKIYTSFNKEQQVCLTFGDQFEIENLEEILSYYNNQTLPKNSLFLRIPQKIKANFAQMKVDLNQHKFMNFSLNAEIKNQENYNGFTITEQQIKISNDFYYSQYGSIFYPGQSIPYQLNVQSNGIENMQLDLNPQIYEKVLENFLAKNYLQQIQVTYRDNLNSNFVVVDNEDIIEIEITIQK